MVLNFDEPASFCYSWMVFSRIGHFESVPFGLLFPQDLTILSDLTTNSKGCTKLWLYYRVESVGRALAQIATVGNVIDAAVVGRLPAPSVARQWQRLWKGAVPLSATGIVPTRVRGVANPASTHI